MAQLAAEAGLDADEALVTLWDAGLDGLLRSTDVVAPSLLDRARVALGLASKRELSSVSYWCNRLDLSQAGVCALLEKRGISLSPTARVLPKGGVAAMRRFERSGDFVLEVAKSDFRKGQERVGAGVPTPPPLEWKTIGKIRELHYLDESQLKDIHQQLFNDFLTSDNPIDTPGTRSEDLLSSACARPRTSMGSTLKYPTVEMGSAALAHSVVNNHPFWNGNKRTALVSLLVFLDEHGLMPTCSDEELFKFILQVSQHRLVPREWPDRSDREVLAMADWIKTHTRPVSREERVIKWRQLRKVLNDHGAWCEQAKNVGNRMNIYREIAVPRKLGVGTKRKTLHVQVTYGDEGREVDRNGIRKLRAALHLDDEHGVDSSSFYDGGPRPVGDFISQYRKILRRLARL